MAIVLLAEFLGQRLAQSIQIDQSVLGDLRAGGATQEEGLLGVFDGLGRTLVERTLGARITGFAETN